MIEVFAEKDSSFIKYWEAECYKAFNRELTGRPSIEFGFLLTLHL